MYITVMYEWRQERGRLLVNLVTCKACRLVVVGTALTSDSRSGFKDVQGQNLIPYIVEELCQGLITAAAAEEKHL